MLYIPKTRPKRDLDLLQRIAARYQITTKPLLVFVRGWYLDTIGTPGVNDSNVWDDAAFIVYAKDKADSFNANTDPSFVRKGKRTLAKLNLGHYRFYKGKHKNKYWALRSYPEGVVLNVTRDGKPSTASAINIHKGAAGDAADRTWSEGCLTVHGLQWAEFQTKIYAAMDSAGDSWVDCILVENRQTPQGQKIFDDNGQII